jgi:hypothetical protein
MGVLFTPIYVYVVGFYLIIIEVRAHGDHDPVVQDTYTNVYIKVAL